MTPTIIALIPARSGSQRVQGKNTRRLGEHPLLAYTIAAAQQSGIFSAVMVSTDDDYTAAIARHYGAMVPFLRPAAYATTTSPDIEWLRHMLMQLRNAGQNYDCFSILRPTSPFRQAATIQRAWQTFLATADIDSIRAVEKVSQHPGKMWVVDGDRMNPFLDHPDGVPWHSTPYQALPVVYIQNASLEIAWTRIVLEKDSIAGDTLAPFITKDHEGFDINDELDWKLAELLLKQSEAQLPQVMTPPYPTSNR